MLAANRKLVERTHIGITAGHPPQLHLLTRPQAHRYMIVASLGPPSRLPELLFMKKLHIPKSEFCAGRSQ